MSVYDKVLGVILEKMRQGVIPWRQHWKTPLPPMNYMSKQPYKGINQLLLGFNPYPTHYYVSMKQAGLLGAKVKPGERGHLIVFYTKVEDKVNVDESEKKYSMVLKYYYVWNLSQTPIPFRNLLLSTLSPIGEEIVKNMPLPPEISHARSNPCYRLKADKVVIPPMEDFSLPDHYYSTLFHELAHATGHPSRLNRLVLSDGSHFGSASYSQEELVAEITCCFLCNETSILQNTLDDSASYIGNWLNTLENNKMMLFRAAGQAQKAADYILGKAENLPVFFSYWISIP
jgi:antirestriction protein ArdC